MRTSALVRALLGVVGLGVLVGLYLVDPRIGWAALTAAAAFAVVQNRRATALAKNVATAA